MTSRGRADSELSGYVSEEPGEIGDGGSVLLNEIFLVRCDKIKDMPLYS